MNKTLLLIILSIVANFVIQARSEQNDDIIKKAIERETHEANIELERISKKSIRPSTETIPLSLATRETKWTRTPESTNGVVVSVVVGAYRGGHYCMRPYFRDLIFDKDGRLVSVSDVRVGELNMNVGAYLPAPAITHSALSLQHTQDHGK